MGAIYGACLFRWCPERFLNNHSGNDGRATALRSSAAMTSAPGGWPVGACPQCASVVGSEQLKREWSLSRIRLDSRKSVRCDDVSEFESYHLSQPVAFLRPTSVRPRLR
jgi:hypothetical protein